MEPITTAHEHIVFDARGTAFVAGVGVKVIEMIKNHLAFGWGPAELHHQYPHLSLEQVNAALTYYQDNKDQLDAHIARRAALADAMEAQTHAPAFVQRLRRSRLTQ